MFNNKKYQEILEFIKKTSNYTKLIAISKNHPVESVLNAISLGVSIFGENRVNEALSKFENIKKES